MKEPPSTVPSAAFRRTFHQLTTPTIVTVNGHTIGTWLPAGHAAKAEAWVPPFTPEAIEDATPLPTSFFDRSFRPAPKPSRKTRP